jgi:hypothetical protein
MIIQAHLGIIMALDVMLVLGWKRISKLLARRRFGDLQLLVLVPFFSHKPPDQQPSST